MAKKRPTLADLLQPLIGRPCIAAEIGLDCTLRLVFEPATGESKESTPMVQSVASAWRIVRGRDVVSGYADCEDWERGLEASLAAISGQILQTASISSVGPADVRFVFGNDTHIVDFLEISRDTTSWEASLPDGQLIDIGPGARVLEAEERLSDFEAAISRHAEKFAARQGVSLAADTSERCCAKCAFWRGMTGGFHFWDYGVCTNPDSPLDGRASHKKNGCKSFGTHLQKD